MLGQAQETAPLHSNSFPMPLMEDQESHNSEDAHDPPFDDLTKHQAYCLFISHTLSMWNSRMYEFSVVRFLQHYFRARKPRNVGP